MSGVIELVAGVLILVGLFTRTAAFVGSGAMAVARFWQHQPRRGDALFCVLVAGFTGVPRPSVGAIIETTGKRWAPYFYWLVGRRCAARAAPALATRMAKATRSCVPGMMVRKLMVVEITLPLPLGPMTISPV
jgi:hypothetical protein